MVGSPPPPPPPPTDHDPFELSPIRAHYLKKSLIQLQFSREIQAITSTANNSSASTLSYLGPPFSSPPKGAPTLDLPFLRYLFRQFVLTFPFLASAQKDFFPDKVQPFISSLLSRNLNSTPILDDESADSAGTAKLIAKAERSFALFLNYAIKTVEKEETVRLSQSDLDRLEAIARKRHAKLMKTKDVFEVNIVCVRTVVDRGRVRSKAHEVRRMICTHSSDPDCACLQEFIILTRRSHFKDVYVSRRYGDFKMLYNEVSSLFRHCPFHAESPTLSYAKRTPMRKSGRLQQKIEPMSAHERPSAPQSAIRRPPLNSPHLVATTLCHNPPFLL
jgi:hypothetical protein